MHTYIIEKKFVIYFLAAFIGTVSFLIFAQPAFAMGGWSGRMSANTVYTASSDGFVVASVSAGSDKECRVNIETPAGTLRQTSHPNHDGVQIALTSPVRRGDTWQVRIEQGGCGLPDSLSIYWIPFEDVLGSWSGRMSANTVYTASSDGFVVASVSAGSDKECRVNIETPAGTLRQTSHPNHDGVQIALTSPVRRGDTWQVRIEQGGCGLPDSLSIYWIPYSPPPTTGTIIVNATKDGQPWDSPPFAEVYDAPYGANQTATIDPTQTFVNMPAGTYTLRSVTPPAGVTLQNVNGASLPYSVNLSAGGTITVTYNFVSAQPSTGTVLIRATKDGQPWDSPPFTVYASIPGSTSYIDVNPPQDISGAPTGMYTIHAVYPPSGVTFQSVNGNQNLPGGGMITFTFNFATTAPPPTLTITPTSATVNAGGTQQFNAIYDPDGSGPQYPYYVTNSSGWSSSDNSVAAVNHYGSATGARAGSATITAQYAGLTNTATLTVTGVSIGTVQIRATKDGLPWDSPPLTVNGTSPNGSFSGTNLDPPRDLTAMTPGMYTFTFAGFFPSAGVEFQNTTPSATQILNPGETITFTFNFRSVSPSPTVSLSANPTSIAAGQSSQLSWTSTNATSCSATGGFSTGGATSGSVSVSPATTSNYQVNCVGPGGSVNSNIVTVTVLSLSDLSAGTITPITATAGTASTFSSTISNGGIGSTGSGFANLFQRANDSLGNGATDIGTHTQSAALSPGANATASLSYAFPSSGVYYLRVCADKSSSSGTGTISESNEDNNCGTWTRVDVVLPAPPTATLSASPEIIDNGQSSTLTWSSTNAASCSAVGGFSTGGATSGSVSISPSTTSNYQVTCTGPGGSVNSNIATVTVVSVTVSISAYPTCVSGGGNSTVSWSASPASQVASCSVSGPGLSSSQVSGSQTVNVTGKSTYVIACRTISGSTITKQAIVDTAGCWSEF